MDLIECCWQDLVGQMPMKICFPAVEGAGLATDDGLRSEKHPWSYHNGGSWAVLLAAAAALELEDPRWHNAITIARNVGENQWAEYYDGKRVA